MKKNKLIFLLTLICSFAFSSCNPVSTNSSGSNSEQSSQSSSSSTSINDDLVHENGIDAILKSFGKFKVNEEEVKDTLIDSIVKFYTFNKLDATDERNPVALYVINHGEERIGSECDVDIINDLLKEYVVVVLDYQKAEKAVSPYLERSCNLHKINMTNNGLYLKDISYDKAKTYLISEGCRIKRDIEFFDIMKHAPKGVVEKTIDVWNNQSQIKDRVGSAWKQAANLDDIVMKNGDSLTSKDASGNYKYLNYKLDIVYHSKPKIEAPTVMYASSNVIRNTAMSGKEDRYQYAGFLFRGYTLVSYDHEYFPFMKDAAGWGHIEPNYTLQTYMGTRFHTAALRCVKYYAQELGYSKEKISVYGHSKSSWVALFKQKSLATADPEQLEEVYTYGGYNVGECFGEQPYKKYDDGTPIPSNVTCVYHSMGNGTNDCRYLAEDNIPQMVGVGEECQYNSWKKFFKQGVYNSLEESGCDFVPLFMYNVGHTYPQDMADELYGYNYYEAFKSFFDHHLKDEPAKLLHTSVKMDGNITEDEEIFVQFSAKVNEQTAFSALKLVDESGNAVDGNWISTRRGNKYVFNPSAPLVVGNKYKIIVDSTIKDLKNHLVEGLEKEFTYAEGAPVIENQYNSSINGEIVQDTYVGSNSVSAKNTDNSAKTTLGTYSSYYRTYLKFNFSNILENPDFETFKETGKIQFKFTMTKGDTNVNSATKFTFKGFTPGDGVSNVDFSDVYWNNVIASGTYPKLHWNESEYLLNGEVQGDNVACVNGNLIFTFDYSQVSKYISNDTKEAVFVLMIPGTSGISLASMENTEYDHPLVSFVYNK